MAKTEEQVKTELEDIKQQMINVKDITTKQNLDLLRDLSNALGLKCQEVEDIKKQ